MEIRKVPIEQLNPAVYNPRKYLRPEDEEYRKLERSIEEFGYIDPIIWNETTGNILGGHQRLKILISMGYTEVEVSVVRMDEATEKSANIALNKISGEWDKIKLAEILDEIIQAGIDATLTGFDTLEIDLLTIPDSVFVGTEHMDLSADYKEPERKKLRCPNCSHVDNADRFKKI